MEKTNPEQTPVYSDFDENAIGLKTNNIYGLPFRFENAKLVLLPVPWDVTVSYRSGTRNGPEAILDASYQVDLYDDDFPDVWKKGIFMLDISKDWYQKGKKYRILANELILLQEKGMDIMREPGLRKNLDAINKACHELRSWVYKECLALLNNQKSVGIIGGDHSVPLGLVEALQHRYTEIGVLQIDAHADLREAYEGFTYSHASIMHNVLNCDHIEVLVQVGIRDLCKQEYERIQSDERIHCYMDNQLKKRMLRGETWEDICKEIISTLPEHVYISFDIDGLEPWLCPDTGTPVPGGIGWDETLHLFYLLHQAGKKIIGFDLCEVAPGSNEWNAIVGARLLYKLSCLSLAD